MKIIKKHLAQTEYFIRKSRQARIELPLGLFIIFFLTFLCMLADIELIGDIASFSKYYEQWNLNGILLFLLWLTAGSIIYTLRRFSDNKHLTRYIAKLAYYDRLTGLPNRTMAFEHLTQKIQSDNSHNLRLAVLFIDFDNLKNVNDQYGHTAGDELIYKVSELINRQMTPNDMLCRIGGDEFLCFMDLGEGRNHLDDVIKKLVACQKTSIMVENHLVTVQFSIGVALYPEHGKTAESLIQAADTAMYLVKTTGKSDCAVFDQDVGSSMRRRRYLENSLRNADFDKEISVLFQPQINATSHEIVTYEVLARWYHDDELINPGEFVDVAEHIGIIRLIDLCVLRKAIHAVKAHLPENVMVSVNISAVEFNQEGFISDIQSILLELDFPAYRLELEITETALISNFDVLTRKLYELKALGIKVAIDDFGVGYSSLARLKDLQVDKLKIDRSFITEIEVDEKQQALVNAIVALAENLKLTVVVEGVENQSQLEILQDYGCEIIQGFYFCRPIDIKAAAQFKLPDFNPLKRSATKHDCFSSVVALQK